MFLLPLMRRGYWMSVKLRSWHTISEVLRMSL